MGEAPAFQHNQQPRSFQEKPPWNPPLYQPYPPQPISQYNLNYQQQQQQQGYNANPNANPYGVPYGSAPAGVAQKKICNPCCCCYRGGCNLRRNCIAIAVFLIIGGVCQSFSIAIPLPIRKECGDKGKHTGWTTRSPQDYNEGYEPDHPKYPEDNRYRFKQSNCSPVQAILVALMVLMAILSIMSGVFLLLAVFRSRTGWAALGAGILMAIISVMLFTNTILLLLVTVKFVLTIDWAEYFNERADAYGPRRITPKWLPFVIFTTLFGIISLGVNIWLTVCAFQLSKQIKAGVDKYPAEGPPQCESGSPNL